MFRDTEIDWDAEHGIDADQPRPIVLRCRHGHSMRRTDLEVARPKGAARRLCAVCGIEVHGASKTCSPEHRRFVERQRYAAKAEHENTHKTWRADQPYIPFRFPLEMQPWYRGGITLYRRPQRKKVERIIPADWWAGWLRVHGDNP